MGKMITLLLPSHWASALINGDESGYDDGDVKAMGQAMAANNVNSCLTVGDDVGFMRYHDAHAFGVLACDCAEYTFISEA